jgi:hypothetical protein
VRCRGDMYCTVQPYQVVDTIYEIRYCLWNPLLLSHNGFVLFMGSVTVYGACYCSVISGVYSVLPGRILSMGPVTVARTMFL